MSHAAWARHGHVPTCALASTLENSTAVSHCLSLPILRFYKKNIFRMDTIRSRLGLDSVEPEWFKTAWMQPLQESDFHMNLPEPNLKVFMKLSNLLKTSTMSVEEVPKDLLSYLAVVIGKDENIIFIFFGGTNNLFSRFTIFLLKKIIFYFSTFLAQSLSPKTNIS
jgi:hypothetical protein